MIALKILIHKAYGVSGPYTSFIYGDRYLPSSKPGQWLPKRKNLEICESGWHSTSSEHLKWWLPQEFYTSYVGIQPHIYIVECRGNRIRDLNKSCWEQIRLLEDVTHLLTGKMTYSKSGGWRYFLYGMNKVKTEMKKWEEKLNA